MGTSAVLCRSLNLRGLIKGLLIGHPTHTPSIRRMTVALVTQRLNCPYYTTSCGQGSNPTLLSRFLARTARPAFGRPGNKKVKRHSDPSTRDGGEGSMVGPSHTLAPTYRYARSSSCMLRKGSTTSVQSSVWRGEGRRILKPAAGEAVGAVGAAAKHGRKSGQGWEWKD